MKKPAIIAIALLGAAILLINGFKGSAAKGDDNWQEGIKWQSAAIHKDEVATAGKPVYLFVSTDWCTFCKRMKSQTFGDKKVQQLLNDLFVPITINPEKQGMSNFTGEKLTYADLAQKLNVTGYPASFFFDSDGKLLGAQPGFVDPQTFADLAEYVGDGHYKNLSFAEFQALPADQRR